MSFFRYPGGKRKLSDIIVSRLLSMSKDSDEYREPFFGAGSIGIDFLSKCKNINKIWINDKDTGIACIWTSIIRCPEKLKKLLSNFIPSVDKFYEFKQQMLNVGEMPKDEDGIAEIGFKKIALHQISYSGLGSKSGGPLGGFSQKSQYKIDCRWSPNYICKKIDKIHSLLSTLNIYQWRCSNFDFSYLLDYDKNTVIYLDPPYLVKGNELYQERFLAEDHQRLCDSMKSKNNWLLSYDNCQEIKNMYDWASVCDVYNVGYTITATKNKETGERLSRIKSEVIISPKEK